MPELAEVEFYRKQWMPARGKLVKRVLLNQGARVFRGVHTGILESNLVGQKLVSSVTHGKQMCFRFGTKHWLGVHLGMTGKLHILKHSDIPKKHDHLSLIMEDGEQLAFSDPRMFGRILFANAQSAPVWWRDLPAEILSDKFSMLRVGSFLTRRARSPIKAVLLMQETFPGLGNWMADEILWRARIHPSTPSGKIEARELAELYNRIREVCQDALEVIGTNWGTPPDSWLFNHRWKDGGLCPKTRALLCRAKIGGRTTCWSPTWQKYIGAK